MEVHHQYVYFNEEECSGNREIACIPIAGRQPWRLFCFLSESPHEKSRIDISRTEAG